MWFSHSRWQKEENASLVTECLSQLSQWKLSLYWWCGLHQCLCPFSLVSFQGKRGAAAETAWTQYRQGRLCWMRWTSIGQVHFFIWEEDTKCLSQPIQKGGLNPSFCSLLADEFHWARLLHQSKLKLEKTQQQGKVPSSRSTSSLQRDIFDNSVSFFPN